MLGGQLPYAADPVAESRQRRRTQRQVLVRLVAKGPAAVAPAVAQPMSTTFSVTLLLTAVALPRCRS